MEKNKLFVLTGLIVCWLLGCQAGLKRDPDVLKTWIGAEPDTLNPILASDAYAAGIHNFVSDSLIDRDPDTLKFRAELARSWEISEDHLVYTFYLRDDVTWHDGHPFTSQDVLYSFERIQDPKVEAPFLRVYYADIERLEIIDDYTVRFTYKKPYFLGLSVCGGIPLVPRHVYEQGDDFNHHPANRLPIGTGPYRFVRWDTNKKLVLQRYDRYWGVKPEIQKIEFVVIANDATSLQILKKHELDRGTLRPIQWVKQTGSEKFNQSFNKFKYLVPGYNYIGWNNQSPLFQDRRVRRAMTHLINREALLEKIQFGLGKIVTNPFFIESNQYNRSLTPYSFDPDQARRLMTEAGWSDTDGDGTLDREGRRFKFTFLYPASSKFAERMATIMKEDMSKVGIEMNIERMEWAAFLAKIEKKEFDATSLGWSASFESDPYQVWHSSQGKIDRGSNFISYDNSEVDRLLEAARVEFDEAKRNVLYQRFSELVHEDQPYTFLYANYSLVVVSKRVENALVHKAGMDMLEWRINRKFSLE